MSGDTRKWTLGGGTTIETNVEGFTPIGAEEMAAALVGAGLMTSEEASAALERRRKRREVEAAARLLGEPRDER